jgi:hypothetical protein
MVHWFGVWLLWPILSKTTSLLKATVLGPARVRIHTNLFGACEMTTTLCCECHVVTWGHYCNYCDLYIYIHHQMINHCHFIGCRIFGQSNLYRTLGSMIFPCMEDFQVFFLPHAGITPWVVVGDPPCPRRRRIPSSSSGGDVFPKLF